MSPHATTTSAAAGSCEPQDFGILGNSPALLAARAAATRVAPTRVSVLITGESGTGKELFARYVHARSGRTGKCVPVNCATLTDSLAESELFGHEKGSFTGAITARGGLFEEAHGGTLFLDEVAELSSLVQSMLLRALQERGVRRVGSTRERPVDVRIVAATHRDLAPMPVTLGDSLRCGQCYAGNCSF